MYTTAAESSLVCKPRRLSSLSYIWSFLGPVFLFDMADSQPPGNSSNMMQYACGIDVSNPLMSSQLSMKSEALRMASKGPGCLSGLLDTAPCARLIWKCFF